MKKILIPLLISVFLLSGCSFLNREYSTIEEHRSSFYEKDDESVLRAENYQDLVNDVLVLVSEHVETGTIWLYSSVEKLDAGRAIDMACREVQNETPSGAYAVNYMTYSVDEEGGSYSEIKLNIGYRRTVEQVHDIIHTTSISALYNLLTTALNNGDTELVLQVGYFNNHEDEVYQIAKQVEEELQLPEDCLEVHFYPEEGKIGIIEILRVEKPITQEEPESTELEEIDTSEIEKLENDETETQGTN